MMLLYISLLASLLLTYAHTLLRVRRRYQGLTPIMGWLVGVGYFMLAPLTIITLQGGYQAPPLHALNGTWDEVNLARGGFLAPYLIVWLSLMMTCLAVQFYCSGSSRPVSKQLTPSMRHLKRIILATMCFTLVDWVVTIQAVGGISVFVASHWYMREVELVERFGLLWVVFSRLSMINQVLFTGASVLYTATGLKQHRFPWGFTSFVVLFFLLQVVMSGNRIFFALFLMGFAASCWIYQRRKVIVAGMLIAPLLMIVFSIWASLRHNLTKISESMDLYVIDADWGNRAVTTMMDTTEGNDVLLLMHVTRDFGPHHDYLYGSTYSRIFSFFLPKAIYPKRPADFTTVLAGIYEPGSETSLAATALGEAYANFGLLGMLLLPALSWGALAYSDRATRSNAQLLAAVGFVLLIWVARSTFAENMITFLGVIAVSHLFGLERKLFQGTAAQASAALRRGTSHPAPRPALGEV